MAKKYNDKSNKFSDWSVKKLKSEALAYHQSIYEIGCYGTKDMLNYDSILVELDKRGYEIGESITIHKR